MCPELEAAYGLTLLLNKPPPLCPPPPPARNSPTHLHDGITSLAGANDICHVGAVLDNGVPTEKVNEACTMRII